MSSQEPISIRRLSERSLSCALSLQSSPLSLTFPLAQDRVRLLQILLAAYRGSKLSCASKKQVLLTRLLGVQTSSMEL